MGDTARCAFGHALQGEHQDLNPSRQTWSAGAAPICVLGFESWNALAMTTTGAVLLPADPASDRVRLNAECGQHGGR
jgi:hypothetical protein